MPLHSLAHLDTNALHALETSLATVAARAREAAISETSRGAMVTDDRDDGAPPPPEEPPPGGAEAEGGAPALLALADAAATLSINVGSLGIVVPSVGATARADDRADDRHDPPLKELLGGIAVRDRASGARLCALVRRFESERAAWHTQRDLLQHQLARLRASSTCH